MGKKKPRPPRRGLEGGLRTAQGRERSLFLDRALAGLATGLAGNLALVLVLSRGVALIAAGARLRVRRALRCRRAFGLCRPAGLAAVQALHARLRGAAGACLVLL